MYLFFRKCVKYKNILPDESSTCGKYLRNRKIYQSERTAKRNNKSTKYGFFMLRKLQRYLKENAYNGLMRFAKLYQRMCVLFIYLLFSEFNGVILCILILSLSSPYCVFTLLNSGICARAT